MCVCVCVCGFVVVVGGGGVCVCVCVSACNTVNVPMSVHLNLYCQNICIVHVKNSINKEQMHHSSYALNVSKIVPAHFESLDIRMLELIVKKKSIKKSHSTHFFKCL